ncbi:hypothetical protein L207DRAFT_511826 [Hyaloscypha variabilis F]|uniref:SGNH hydrolase n=1 Tax=Hyaloscypha variabilis (strain UAMH 11265 / GT02V1 / F) TaxID=1149755 RepID=A0A2J6RP73_HYAVF|nr:hypothetical protein L207DRAFT_511826 [Hyaloscypha variabilis F]
MSVQVALAEGAAQAVAGVGLDYSTRHPLPSLPSFFAFGDSFSAGIGANCGWIKDEFDEGGSCLKCDGGYPYQIIEVANTSSSDSEDMEVFHLGCTGASMNDIVNTGWNNRTSQLELMKMKAGQAGWGTLSVGGNDVGFANIVANCIMFGRPSCDADLNFTENLISDARLIGEFTTTYLKILGTARQHDFRLIVTNYAQFFNAEIVVCDNWYIFYGRYLTREFRARINKMVADLNLVIQIAVSIVQLQLVFGSSQKGIYFEDWNSLFSGHRFCEEPPLGWVDAWFFTINGEDILPNKTLISSWKDPPEGELPVNLTLLASSCDAESTDDLTAQMLCNWALNLEEGRELDGNLSTVVYPWWITKTLHPKSVAHFELAKAIYEKWLNGDYF